MKNSLHFFIFIFFALCTACSYTGELEKVIVDEQLSIGIPDYMTDLSEDNALSTTASIQYGNHFRHFYMVILHEPKAQSGSIAEYTNKEYDLLVSRLTKPQRLDSLTAVINDQPVTQISVTGTVGKDDFTERMYYRSYFMESKTKNYQVVFWTWDTKRATWLPEIERIMESVKGY